MFVDASTVGGRLDFTKQISLEIHVLQLSNLGTLLNMRCSVSDTAIVYVAKANIVINESWWFSQLLRHGSENLLGHSPSKTVPFFMT